MGRVRRSAWFEATPTAAESLWTDPVHWPSWVDGLARVTDCSEAWPQVGATASWESTPHGRGRVSERVSARDPGAALQVAFEDDHARGRQDVFFVADGDGVRVTVAQEWTLRDARRGGAIVDWVFIRRAVGDSLLRTLAAFGQELEQRR